jgi:hypothetical protein
VRVIFSSKSYLLEVMASCRICQLDPKNHNFIHFGNTAGGVALYYTNPAKSKELIDTPEKFVFFKTHLDEAKGKGKWIWIFDCAGMRTEHFTSYQFTKSMMQELSNDQLESIQGLWIIHPNTWMRASITFVKPLFKSELIQKIRVFENKREALIVDLQKSGFTAPAGEWIAKETVLLPLPVKEGAKEKKKSVF